MTDPKARTEITSEEIEAQVGSEQPERDEMSLADTDIEIPVNATIAANVLSDGSIAYADTLQEPPSNQST